MFSAATEYLPRPIPMSSARVIVVGSVNTDLVIRGPRLPRPGETVLGGTFFQAPGGKGANQAVAAARAARDPVTFVAAVGDDALGDQAAANLRRENIDARFLRTIPAATTGVALILVDEHGQNMISVASGANMLLVPADIDALPGDVFAPGGVLLCPLESPLDTVLRALQRAKAAGLTTIVNPAPADARICDPDVAPLIDVLTPNSGEALTLAGLPGPPDDDPQQAVAAATRLHQAGCRAVIVTLGARGSLLYDGRPHLVPPIAGIQAIDATAAGDAYNGALAVALAEGCGLSDAAHFATRAAAISVTRRGAQPSLPTRSEIDAASRSAPR